MAEIADLKAFDLDAAELTVWVFKKVLRDGRPVYRGRWVNISDTLAENLRTSVVASILIVDETIEYDILAQNHETSFLKISADETYVSLLNEQVANPTDARKVRSSKDLENTEFYLLKFVSELGTALGCEENKRDVENSKISRMDACCFLRFATGYR